MTCKLCLKENKLCNSHIIPEFFFKPLYDKQLHRYHVLSSAPEKGNTFYQKGVRERLLCLECEKLFSTYEKYANDFLFNKGLPKKISNYKNAIIVDGIDYKKFKFFLLSILWRASVSKHPMFQEIDLGPHEEKLRHRLINEDPGEPHHYGCIPIAMIDDKISFIDLILSPEYLGINHGHRLYRFVMGGLIWIFVVSSHAFNYAQKQFFFQKDGVLAILKKDAKSMPFLVGFAHDLKIKGKLPGKS